jgi:hypothetical protein
MSKAGRLIIKLYDALLMVQWSSTYAGYACCSNLRRNQTQPQPRSAHDGRPSRQLRDPRGHPSRAGVLEISKPTEKLKRKRAEALRLLLETSIEREGRLQTFSGIYEDDTGAHKPYLAMAATDPEVIAIVLRAVRAELQSSKVVEKFKGHL